MKSILAVLLAAILLFGCAQQGGGTQAGTGAAGGAGAATGGTGAGSTGGPAGTGATGGTTGGATGGSTGGATGGATGAAGGATGGTAGTETDGTGDGTGTGGGNGPSSMTTWSMEYLAALGVPVHCTVTYTGSMAGTYDIYILGQNSAMTGTIATAGGNQQFNYVFKDNKIYMPATLYASLPGFEGCDWVTRSVEPTTSTQDSTANPETPPATFECVPDVFGEEKFATPGTECDFNTAMTSVCNQLPAEARQSCIDSLSQ